LLDPAPEYIVKKLTRDEYKSWNKFVLDQRDGTIFHTTYWLEPLCSDELRIVAIFRKGKICAGFPMIIRKVAGARMLLQPPMTPYSGPVLSDAINASILPDFVEHALNTIISEMDSFRFSLPPQSSLAKPVFRKHLYEHDFRTNRLMATLPPFDLMEHISGSLRRNIRKAEKNGLRIEKTNDIKTVYDLSAASYKNSGRRHPLKYSTFSKLHQHLSDHGLSEARIVFTKEGKPAAAAWTPFDARAAYNVIHGIEREFSSLQGGPYVLFKTAESFLSRGVSFDFEGSMKDRIHHFYQKFNPETCSYSHFHKNRSFILKLLNQLRLIHV